MVKDFPHSKPLKTKYSIPQTGRFVISREHLLEKLDNAAKYLLTTIIAPVGYGKTTAVLDWLRKRDQNVAWLSLDAYDNDQSEFWQYVCAALDGLAPGLSKHTDYTLTSRELMEAGVHLRIIIDQLSEKEDDFFLILDNLNVIFNPVIFGDLSYLLEFSPPRLHLIFLGRREPNLDLTKLSLSGELQRITVADLRFSEEEITQYFTNRSLLLDGDMRKKVEVYTDGWAAALTTIALSCMERSDRRKMMDGIAQDHGNIGKYLLDTVLDSYSAEKREFIIKTSILNTLCPGSCAAVTGLKNADKILKQMYAQDGFLLLIDDEGQNYRYSPFFRDDTYRLLKSEFSDSIITLHRKAALWYDQNGKFNEAVDHYLKGEEYTEALRLMEPRFGELAGANAYETVISWINQLPAPVIEKNIGIALFYALYYSGQRRLETAKIWLMRAKELQAANLPSFIKNPEVPIWLTSVYLAISEGDMEELVRLWESISPEKRGVYRMNGLFDLNPADIFFYRSRVNKYIKFIIEQNGPWQNDLGEHRFMSIDAGYSDLIAGEYYYEHNQFELARPSLLKTARVGETIAYPGALVPALAGLSRIKRAMGDSKGALELLDRCDDLLKTMNQPHWHNSVNALRHRFLLEDGNIVAVEEWLNSTHLSVFTKIDNIREYELLVFVRVLIFEGRTDEAEQLLTRLLAHAEAEGKWHTATEILNLFAILSFHLGERQNMARYMIKSLQIGIREGYFRSYVDEGPALLIVLEQSVLCGKEGAEKAKRQLAERITRQIRLERKATPKIRENLQATTVQHLLTAKELEVLTLLYNACSNKEIGQRLGISLRTVKTHTGNIYGKLGVLTRTQCIKIVRELGIFEK